MCDVTYFGIGTTSPSADLIVFTVGGCLGTWHISRDSMLPKHLPRCGCTASGFLDWARMSSNSSLLRK